MLDRDVPMPLHPAASSDLEAQWAQAAGSLGLDAAADPVLEPQVKSALVAQMQALMETGDYAAALEPGWLLAYDDPWNRDHALDFALCLQHLGELESACRFYSTALLLDATDAYCLFRIGECLQGLQQREDARAAFLGALELAREDPAYAQVGQEAAQRLDAMREEDT
jgi:tetratricopeptide (TPR) repeat protein